MPNMLDRISDRLGHFLDRTVLEQRAASPGYGLYTPRYQIDSPRWVDGNIGNYRKAFASQVAVYSCVLARARAVSAAPMRVYQEVQGDQEEQTEHPMRALMTRPNPMMSEAEFLVMTQMLMDATGFAAIEKVRAGGGNVVQLWHLRSDWLQEITRAQQASDWQYLVPGNKPWLIKAEDILIVAGGPSTDLSATGMSPIAVALREAGIDAALTDFLKIFIDSGGMPRQAIVMPDMVKDQQQADEIRGRFQQAYGGFRNWTSVALLSGGADVKTIGSSIEELAYPQLRALTETHICSVFGVPPIIAGIQAGIDASTYSNYEQARKAFFEDTVQGLWSRIDGAFTRGLLSEFTDDPSISLEFDTTRVPALQEDKQKIFIQARLALTAGGLTVNQFQMAVGLPGFGIAGDVLYMSTQSQPIRPDDLLVLADRTAEPPQPVPAALVAGNEGGDNNADKEDPASDAERGRGSTGLRDGVEHGSRNGRDDDASMVGGGRDIRILTLPLETRSRIVTDNRRGVSNIAAKFTPRLRTMFRRQGGKVAAAYAKRSEELIAHGDTADAALDALEAKLREQHETRALQIPWDDLESETLRELNGLYEAAGKMAFAGAGKALGVGIDWDLSNPFVIKTLKQLARRVKDINKETRKDVAKRIVDGIEEGLSTPQIADTLKGLFEETYKGRAMTIARTESQLSYNLATADAYRASGIVMAMTCHDNPDHTDSYGASDGLSCAERNGVITDVDAVAQHIFAEHPNGSLAVSPLLVRPLGSE